MLADRYRERLAGLDHETLLSYAAELSFAHRHTADALLAKHSPLPAWARDEVLLSADLLPHVFATLQLEDNAAASVCQAWKAAWVATNDGRRGLRPAALPHPDFPTPNGIEAAAALPNGNLLVVADAEDDDDDDATRAYEDFYVVDPDMQTVRVVEDLPVRSPIGAVANDLGLFAVCNGDGRGAVRRYDLDSFEMTHEHDAGLAEEAAHRYKPLLYLTLAAGGLLFALGTMGDDEEIVCFDARTLEVRHRFGRGLCKVYGMAAVGNELFVLDRSSNAIKIFSLAGAHLRSFGLGGCVFPQDLHHFDGRLYLLDGAGNGRIIVLTPEGERLQVWKPDAGREIDALLCIYGRKLLMRTVDAIGHGHSSPRLEALQGI